MPWPGQYAAEVVGVRARRRRCKHEPMAVLDKHRVEAGPFVVVTELGRCLRCEWLIQRTRRYGPGSDGDTGWVTVP